jgi:hypothetical protein
VRYACDLNGKNLGKIRGLGMVRVQWEINEGDLVKISPSGMPMEHSYGIVISKEPFDDQLSMFPAVMVFCFAYGRIQQYYPYNLKIVSAIT